MVRSLSKINFVFISVLLCCLTVGAQVAKECEPPNVFDYDDEHTLTVDAKTLLANPKCFAGKFIRTIGFYSYGFEISSLYCPDCRSGGFAWLNTQTYHAAIKRCTPPDSFKFLSKDGSTLGIVALGVLRTRTDLDPGSATRDIGSKRLSEARGGFGHMNAYDSEFSPICFEEIKRFSKYSVVDDERTFARMRKWYEKMTLKY